MKFSNPRIYGSGVIQPDPRWHMAPHYHSFHEIIVVKTGRMLLKSESEEWTAVRGDILFYRAGFVHEEISDSRSPVSTCFIAFETGDPLSWLPLRLRDSQARVRQLVSWLVDDERERRAMESRQALFEALFSELRTLCGVSRDPWLESVIGFIRKNFANPLTLDDLARMGKMSKFAFARKFKQLCGRTPMAELRLTRLEHARTLLLTTNLPVKAIAPAVGIGDEFQLAKLFRLHFDMAPSQLRTQRT